MVFMAAFVAACAAFVACSSDDDLVQQAPEVPEVKGTPFSISVGADTRATLYNADAWGATGVNTKVTMLKLYGKQTDQTTPWLNNVVFTRASTSTDWSANRDAEHDALGDEEKPTWPKSGNSIDSSVDTKFYAITDNAIGDGKASVISGVDDWMNPVGSFTYGLTSKTEDISWYNIIDYEFQPTTTTYVDPDKLKDLMVSTTTTNESGASNGKVELGFKHALSNLVIKAKFLSDGESNNHITATIKSIMVCGLNTEGTCTIGLTPTWSALGTPMPYYKVLATPVTVTAIPENSDAQTIENNTKDIVHSGEWLVIPQKTTPWDLLPCETAYPSTAYISIEIHDSADTTDDNSSVLLTFPLNTTFNPGKNRIITIDIAQGRVIEEDFYTDPKNPNSDGKADLYYGPTTVVGA